MTTTTMHSKRFTGLKTSIAKKTLSVKDGVALVKKNATAKFDETVEIHFNLGIDPKAGDQQIRGTISLPNGQEQNGSGFCGRGK
jgi:large subunit ribosomal protein L1